MKKIINKVLHWLNFSIIALMLMLVVLLSGLYFASTRFAEYRSDLEQFVSKIVQHPVQIEEFAVGSHGLEPMLRLRNIVIFNETKTKKLFQAQELQISIDLVGSLLTWQIKPDLLLIRGSELDIYQGSSGKISVAGISSTSTAEENSTPLFSEASSWLFEQSRIDLEDIVLRWHLAYGKVIKLSDLYLKLYNGVLQHELKINGKLEQPKSPAIFEAELRLRGDVLKQSELPLSGEVIISNWLAEVDTWNFPKGGPLVPSGDINLTINHSTIIVKLLRQPLAVNNIAAKVSWHHDDNGLRIEINKLKFSDDWLSISGDSQFLFSNNAKMPIIDLQLGIRLTNLAKAKLYYPVTLLPRNATRWLDQAFVKSKLISGSMILQGPLDKFPFDNNEGKFIVDTNIRDVCLNYDPLWPRIDNITGKMVFAGRSMTILARSAKIMRQPTKLVKAVIPNLNLPILHIDGAIDADSSVGLNFVSASPLKNTVGKKLQDISLTGLMKFRLKFDMPLSDEIIDQNTKVAGNIELCNNYIRSDAWNIGIENLSGNLHFDSDNFITHDFKGKLFNKPVTVTINNLNPKHQDVITRVIIHGNADVVDLEKAFAFKLFPYANGSLSYKVLLDLHSAALQNVFKFNSNLHGIELQLPEPFKKNRSDAYFFNLIGYFGGTGALQVNINYNNQISAALAVKKNATKDLQILGGEINFGGKIAKFSEATGLIINGNLDRLDWRVWKDWFARSQTNFATAGSKIKQVSLDIAKLHVFRRLFKQVSLKAWPKDNGWVIAFLMPDIEGSIYFPSSNKAAIMGEFKKLSISEGQETLATVKLQDLSALNFKINNFRYGSKYFDQVAFITEPQPRGIKITKFTLSGAKFSASGSGGWVVTGADNSSVFRGKISSNDIGGLLKQWDLTDNMLGGKGTASFVLKWPNVPYKPTLQTINGDFSINLTEGRIINLSRKTENRLGFGRVLNLFSLQSLPRRLSLDFSDLTQKGFAFDTMVGDCELADGNANVRKLGIEGAIARIEAYGRIGLKTQDYDIMLNVVPHIATSIPAATAGTIIGGPVGAIVGLIADNIMSSVKNKVVKKVTNYNYHVTGSWEQPNIDKI